MKRRNKKLEWFALMEDFNNHKLITTNVLGESFAEELLKRIKKEKIDNYASLKEIIKGMLKHRFWSRAEYEMIISSLIGKPENYPDRYMEEKIDIWYQLEPNLDRIVEYIMKELQIEF